MRLTLKIDAPDYGPTASMRQDQKWRGDLSRELRRLADSFQNAGATEGPTVWERDGMKITMHFERGQAAAA